MGVKGPANTSRGYRWMATSCTRPRTFLFSRRRRHTSWPRDWSSDVCSSDLPITWNAAETYDASSAALTEPAPETAKTEIGRASCRERVESSVAGGARETEKAQARARGERRADNGAQTPANPQRWVGAPHGA